jgi:hypothetical protein
MDKRNILIALATIAFALPTWANTSKKGVYSPGPGVVCDSAAHFCSDAFGISMGITEMHLGAASAKTLLDMINEVGTDSFNSKSFVLSNGVKCDIDSKKCTKSKYDETTDTKTTTWLFGTTEDAAETYNHLEGKSAKNAGKELSHNGFKMKGITPRESEIWFNSSNKQCLEIYKDNGAIGSIQASDSDMCR